MIQKIKTKTYRLFRYVCSVSGPLHSWLVSRIYKLACESTLVVNVIGQFQTLFLLDNSKYIPILIGYWHRIDQ